jgi:hypothetical protein
MDERTVRSFLVARGLMDRADLAVDGTPVGAVASVVLLDLAVETGAKATVAAHPPTTRPGRDYLLSDQQRRPGRLDPSLPQVLDDVLAAWRLVKGDETLAPRELREAARLREYRNNVQHAGVVPHDEDIRLSRLRARGAVEWLARSFFDTDLDAVSRAMLLSEGPLRDRVVVAERHAAMGEWREAVAQLWIAFQDAVEQHRSRQKYRRRATTFDVRAAVERATGQSFTGTGRNPFGGSTESLTNLLTDVLERTEGVEETLEVMAMGAEAADYAWFRAVAPRPSRTMGDAKWRIDQREPLRSQSDWQRAYDFVLSTMLRWQQAPVRDDDEAFRSAYVGDIYLPDPGDEDSISDEGSAAT